MADEEPRDVAPTRREYVKDGAGVVDVITGDRR
jgi:hypothetical protein